MGGAGSASSRDPRPWGSESAMGGREAPEEEPLLFW